MNEKISFRSRGGWKIVGVLHLPRGKNVPGVVICHGFASDKDRSGHIELAEALRKAGFAALRIDMYGSGESAGKFEGITVTKQVKDLRGALDFMERHPGIDSKRLGVIGSSLGGMVASLGASMDKRVKSLVLKYPVSDMEDVVNRIFGDISEGFDLDTFLEGRDDSKIMKLRYEFYTNATEHPVYKVTDKIRCPVLVFHGTSDRLVPFSQSRKLVKMLGKPSRIKRVRGADHGFNQSQQRKVSEEAVKWFRKYLGVER